MKEPALLLIDQGTSATKGFLFDEHLKQLHTERIPHRIHRPRPGWAETDASDIAEACQKILGALLTTCRSRDLMPRAMGMAFQRSTFLFWTKRTVRPVTPALSWQDTRSAPIAARLKDEARGVQERTGIPLSAHFGGPKFAYSVGKDDRLKSRVSSGELFFGPLSAFVTHVLTGRAAVDRSIAGRSLLIGLEETRWNGTLLDLFEVPSHCLPKVVPTCHPFGEVKMDSNRLPLLCVIGDQQASLVGLKGIRSGHMALNLGTSGSVLVNSGQSPKRIPSILASVLYSFKDETRFLLEGSINSVGSLFRWLESYLHIPHRQMSWEDRCGRTTRGFLIPGINGIAAPYWTDAFETAFRNLSPKDDPDGVVRAAMESIGFLVADIFTVLQEAGGVSPQEMVASGGYSRPVLLQFIADLLDRPIWSSRGRDMTALGVARLLIHQTRGAPLDGGSGVRARKFKPSMPPDRRSEKIAGWRESLTQLGIHLNLETKRGD